MTVDGMRRVRKIEGLMAVGLAVAAVIARHGRLDDAGPFHVGAGRHGKQAVARVQTQRPRRRERRGLRRRAGMTCDRVADERAKLLLSHVRALSPTTSLTTSPTTSTVSTIPTTAASTGASLRPSASPAA